MKSKNDTQKNII